MFGEDRWKSADYEVNSIIRLLSLKSDDQILDACCGVGRHSIGLSQKGYTVTGIDNTKKFLQAARSFAKAENVSPVFLEGDILKFQNPNSFDAIINMYTSFGYFASKEDDLTFLKNMFLCLKDKGRILIETIGKEILSRIFQPKEWYEHEGAFVLADYEIIDDWSKLKNRWIIIKDKDIYDYSFSHRLYSASELKELLFFSGFRKIRTFGNFSGAPYDHSAETLVIVAEKESQAE